MKFAAHGLQFAMACDTLVRYSRDQLLKLCSIEPFSNNVESDVRRLRLRAVCRLRVVSPRGHIGLLLSSLRHIPDLVSVYRYRGRRAGKNRERHSVRSKLSLIFGCLNVRSLNSKLDDVLEVRRDQLIDVSFSARHGMITTPFALSVFVTNKSCIYKAISFQLVESSKQDKP